MSSTRREPPADTITSFCPDAEGSVAGPPHVATSATVPPVPLALTK
jgi:hypothetical protein